MEITIGASTSEARGNFGALATTLSSELEGRKTWVKLTHLRFETTHQNLKLVQESFPGCTILDRREGVDLFEQFALDASGLNMPSERPRPKDDYQGSLDVPASDVGDTTRGYWPFRMEPLDFQLGNFNKFKDKPQFAIFSEQGTGKTKVFIDIMCYRYVSKMIDAVVVLSSPKGVHAQWVEQQLPKHLWEGVSAKACFWDGKRVPEWFGRKTPGELQIFSTNIDSVIHARPLEPIEDMMRLHGDRLLLCVDESDSIKSASSRRNKELRRLADKYGVRYRAIMTGTPIAKDLTDEWAQLLFLNPAFLGHKYKTSFMAQYCRMGGFEGRSVVGHRNIEGFRRLTAPHVFRATKAQLKLPPKIYDEVVFDLTDEQRRLAKSLKESFIAELNGRELTVNNAAVMIMRLQQLACGYIKMEDGTYMELERNPRLDALIRLRQQTSGKAIIWCRFNKDIESVTKALGSGAVSYYGPTSTGDRTEAKHRFMNDPTCTDLVANPAAMGKGVDGLQEACQLAIYYSNSFDAIHRWQSEDRIHRIGQTGTATYFDMVARGSPDRAILANLRRKKGLSDLVLDDIKRIINDYE